MDLLCVCMFEYLYICIWYVVPNLRESITALTPFSIPQNLAQIQTMSQDKILVTKGWVV